MDFASIGIEVDSRPVVEGTKALDGFGDASTRVEQKVRVTNGQMSDTAKIMQMQAAQAKAAADANAVLGGSTSALTIGQVQLIEKFREQAATIGMSRSQLMAYQAAQLGVTEQTKDAIAAVKAYEDAIKAKKAADDAARNSTSLLTDALKLLAKGYVALQIADVIKDSAMQAARYETLGVVMGVVGKTAGYTAVQMDTAAKSIAAQGITMLSAREDAIKLVQAHVDLTNATKLARIAQDAAVIGNINSSEAFDRLVNGVARGNVLILRNIGINVNLGAAYQQMAASLGKTSAELTENERVQARLNAVIERGTDIAGTYEAAMGTAAKQILSMQRYVSDLKTTFGEVFSESLTIAVMALTDQLKDANGEVSDLARNHQLEEWGHDLTNVFVTIANEASNAVTTFQKLSSFVDHFNARRAINADFDAQSKRVSDTGNGMAEPGAVDKINRIEAARAAALAEENADYVKQQVELNNSFDRFERAAEEREATRLAKQKADAAARLKVDEDYAKAATALMTANQGKSLDEQRAAQMALYKSTYVGTPNFRDTEGRETAPKVDQADNERLQNHLARIHDQEVADKAYADYAMQLDDQRHKAGELGDEEYFKSQKAHLDAVYMAEQAMYVDELAALRAHHNSTDAEREKNQKAIDDILGKQAESERKYSHDSFLLDDAERIRQAAIASASQDASNKYISGLNAEADKLEQSNGAHERSRSAIEQENVARINASIALEQQFIAQQTANGANQKEIDQAQAVLKYLQDMRDARQRLATGYAAQEAGQLSKKMADQAIQDWQRAGASIAQSLSSAFGAGGKAIGEMFKAYSDGMAGRLRAEKDLAEARNKYPKDSLGQIEAINRANLEGAQAQVKSYGDMAQAAQGFFKEGSTGYKAMTEATEVLRVAEVALSLVKGVNAVLTQGEGDPYSAFGRMAAMAAIVAGLGVALTGGGGSGVSAADRQAAQGTGTVLGDSSAKSDSIARAIELSASNSSTQINYLSGMLTALQSIQTNITGFASQLVQSTNISNPDVHLNTSNGLGKTIASWGAGGVLVGSLLAKIPVLGNLFDKVGTAIFGGKQSLDDSGFTMDKASLASILTGGTNARTYADITTSGGWFSSDKHSTQTTALGADANNQFTAVIKSLADSVTQAGKLLGVSGDAFTNQLDSFVVDIGKVSLKGLSADEIQKQLESVFSKLGDQMAQAAIPNLTQFEQVGEGYLQTLVRVASDYAKVDASMQSIGRTFGSVGLSSIAARESLISLMGGIDKLQSTASDYAQNFLTKAQQLAPVQAYVTQQLDSMNLGWVQTRQQFASVVQCLDLTTASGQQTYAALMGLESAFAAVTPAIIDTSKSAQDIADERKGLQDQFDQLTMTQTQLLTKQRDALDASNQSLFDMVQAAQKLADTSTNMAKFRDAAQSLSDSLATGSLSTLTPEQQYQQLRDQYEKVKAAALAGDTTAQDNYSSSLTSFLTASQKINGGDSQYQADFTMGQQDAAAMASWASNQVDTATAQLQAMQSQNTELNTANTSLQTLVDTVKQLQATNADLAAEVAALRADQNSNTGEAIAANAEVQQNAADTIVSGLSTVITKVVSTAQKVTLE